MTHVDVERVLPIMEEYIEKHHYTVTRGEKVGGTAKFVYATGLNHRFVFDTRNGRKKTIDTFSLDKILTGLDLTHLAHWPQEKGGFADVFTDLPEKPKGRGPYKKKNRRKVPCECGREKHHAATRCGVCHAKHNEKKARHCVDCQKKLTGGYSRNDTPRCRPCWDEYRKTRTLSDSEKRWQKDFRVGRRGYE